MNHVEKVLKDEKEFLENALEDTRCNITRYTAKVEEAKKRYDVLEKQLRDINNAMKRKFED